MNNFQKLAEEQGLYEKMPPAFIKTKVTGTMGLLDLLSSLVDLFIPKVLSTFKDMLGGRPQTTITPINNKGFDISQKPPKYPNRVDLN